MLHSKNLLPNSYNNTFGSNDSYKLSAEQIQSIINTNLLSNGEKFELLELNLGLRMLTECGLLKFGKIRKDGFTHPSARSLKDLENFLKTLPFPYKLCSRKVKRLKINAYYFYIFSNRNFAEYFKQNKKKISAFEIGIYYNYHPKAVLAFGGFLESFVPQQDKQAYQYYNSKVYTKDFYDEIDRFEKENWEKIREVAPDFILKLEKDFKKKYKNL